MKEILNHLYKHKELSEAEAEEVLKNIAAGKYPEVQVASFLTVFIMRGITVNELKGFRKALLDLCLPIDLGDYRPIDMCGTGGDGKNTFNVSTLSAFVVAGTGIKVAKHGNYGVSSVCGSSNVLEQLGVKFSNDENRLKSQLEEANICILHAPLFHPAMKEVAPVRKGMGVQTFFNMLGPMVNPSKPPYQLVGVFSLDLARKYQYIYQELDKKYAIIHGLDGYDEVSLTADTKVISNSGEQILGVEAFGFETVNQSDLFGGDTIEEAADIFMQVLQGKGTKVQNNVVLANAALAIRCVKDTSIEESKALAEDSLLGGKALNTFQSLVKTS